MHWNPSAESDGLWTTEYSLFLYNGQWRILLQRVIYSITVWTFFHTNRRFKILSDSIHYYYWDLFVDTNTLGQRQDRRVRCEKKLLGEKKRISWSTYGSGKQGHSTSPFAGKTSFVWCTGSHVSYRRRSFRIQSSLESSRFYGIFRRTRKGGEGLETGRWGNTYTPNRWQ